jgi:PIN domain nuclease of toxin-antitoxin system
VLAADETRINRDPFDCLVCAAARDLGLPLLTRDSDIRAAGGIRVIW